MSTTNSYYTSPKRKREPDSSHSFSESPPPQRSVGGDSPGRQQQVILQSGEGSPRARVAIQLENLRLKGDGTGRLLFGRDGATEGATKRPKPDHGNINDFSDINYNSPPDKECYLDALEFSETPARLGASDVCENKSHVMQPQPQPTPHPMKAFVPKTEDVCRLKGRNKSPPLLKTQNTSPEPQNMTWRDDEITGHRPDDPDDDGEGLNCIGFKPTPAIAYARTQHRKQQVVEWKSREAREARQKRSERRRGVIDASTARVDHSIEHGQRKVRFEEQQS